MSNRTADRLRSGVHPAAANHRTIAVREAASGKLYVGSSNGFDAGQRAAIDIHGVQRVPGSGSLHAEEELLRAVPDLQRAGRDMSHFGQDLSRIKSSLNGLGREDAVAALAPGLSERSVRIVGLSDPRCNWSGLKR